MYPLPHPFSILIHRRICLQDRFSLSSYVNVPLTMVFLDGALVSCAGTSSLADNRAVAAHLARTTLIICSNHASENVIALFSWYALQFARKKCQISLDLPFLPVVVIVSQDIPIFPRQLIFVFYVLGRRRTDARLASLQC